MSFETHTKGSLVYHTSTLLEAIPHAFSTRKGGISPAPWDSLNLGPSRGDALENVVENYRLFFAPLGLNVERSVLSKQVHETTVRLVTEEDVGKGLFVPRDYTADSLICQTKHIPLVVFSADCNVMLFYDPVKKAIGATHAGWRGTAMNIGAKTVLEMVRIFGCDPADIRVAIGSSIGPCCFETHNDVPDAMREAFGEKAEPFLMPFGEKWKVDLKSINAMCLKEVGVTQIDVSPLCTACRQDLYWSHRMVGNARGVQTAVISLED